MRYPWANVALLLLLLIQLITGFFGFINGVEENQWILWLHGVGAYAIVLILFWKGSIILSAYRRRKDIDHHRIIFAILLLLVLATLVPGLLWTLTGPQYFLGFSLLTWHIFLAIPVLVLAIWHIIHYRWLLSVPEAKDRRAFLRITYLTFGGITAWWLSESIIKRARPLGGTRRFTGSYETGSYTGQFPQVSWIADRSTPIDLASWRLVVTGAVKRPLELSYEQLLKLEETDMSAILDCTGGWYSEQAWRGVSVARLLAMAQPNQDAKSVTFEAVSGYRRRFGINDTSGYLLATKVADNPLSHGHGFPVRLVAPGQRGVYWVKWIQRLQVNTTGKYWQLPLPLQ